MNYNLKSKFLQVFSYAQAELLPFLKFHEPEKLTAPLTRLVRVLDILGIEQYLPEVRGSGRKPVCRAAIARAFVAKSVLGLPSTEALRERLSVDKTLRSLCGFHGYQRVPSKHVFSRAFAEFSAMDLPALAHSKMVQELLGEQLLHHVSHDSTAISARERPVKVDKQKHPRATVSSNVCLPNMNSDPSEVVSKSSDLNPSKRKRGRPRKGETVIPKEPSIIEQQQKQSLSTILRHLPKACDYGCKKNSQGFKDSWQGYKLHISTADGDIPVAAILTSASTHDSQVLTPLIMLSGQRTSYCYDLADAAYCNEHLREFSRQQGHVPLFDHNPRRGDKKEFEEFEKKHYAARSGAERVNARLKDSHGGNTIYVKGHQKVYCHLMFGVAVVAAVQLLSWMEQVLQT